METHLIEMDPDKARGKYEAAIEEKHADSKPFAQACASAYEHLASGQKLIALSRSIQRGGLDENGMPRLAVARADRREVMFNWERGRYAYFTASKVHSSWNPDQYPSLIRHVDMGQTLDGQRRRAFTLVPAVPPDVRPPTGQLCQWYILWEVDQWYARPQHMRAPRDPFLLKHIGGDLYAVLAEWDLTEVERLILEDMVPAQ